MFDYQIKKLPKKTFELLVKIPQTTIKDEYKNSFERLQKELEVEGFRKGKVPRAIAEKHLKKEAIYEETIKELLPKIYQDILKKENLQPIINPKIELVKEKENESWEVKITIAGRPTIELKDYKTIVQKAKAKAKKEEIWVPGKTSDTKPDKEKDKQKIINEILNGLLNETELEISDLIVEDELNRRLTQLLDEIQKIGLTVEAYLKSKNLTMDQLKERFKKEISDTYKLEFILQEIADKEEIKVEKADIDKLLSAIKEEKERKLAEQNAYFYAAVLRKQKTLDFLLSL